MPCAMMVYFWRDRAQNLADRIDDLFNSALLAISNAASITKSFPFPGGTRNLRAKAAFRILIRAALVFLFMRDPVWAPLHSDPRFRKLAQLENE
jgi:hypothetical protein